MQIRILEAEEMLRIGEIDRSQHVTQDYVWSPGGLELEDVDWHVPRWSVDGDHAHSVRGCLKAWQPFLGKESVIVGALDEEKLVGLAVYRPRLSADTAQLAILHVSNGYRRQGIGASLVEEVVRLARSNGATNLYVSAAPSRPTVKFYLKQGFRLAEHVNKELYEMEPEDIHMLMNLEKKEGRHT
jgi:GNAT superfamily N-acetyltransferase